ncbi:MAG: NUDIX domain-containing protein [Anaerolineae bacterium]
MKSNGGTTVVVIDEEQQVLLHKRRDFRIWALPGGGIEPGESGEQAAVREVREETGYEITLERRVGTYRRPQIVDGEDQVYLGRVTGGVPIRQGAETRAVRWFSVDALPRSLPSWHRTFIWDAMSGVEMSATRTLRLPPLEVGMLRFARWIQNVWSTDSNSMKRGCE